MFKLFRRAVTKAAKRTATANLRAATDALQTLAAPASKAAPAPKAAPRKRAAAKAAKAAPAKPVAAAKPRAGLGETLRWIESGGMPARAPVSRRRPSLPRGATFKLAHYANDQDKRSYKLYVPARAKTLPPSALMPLVVMLHGCGQTPDDFAAGTRMNALAEEFGLLVAYPSQPSGANANRCWNWFKRGDQVRGAGEPALIAGIARAILAEHRADPARVYVAGLSAGGSAANVLVAAYPDVFAAAGVHSGVPAGAAHNSASAFLAMQQGAPGDRPAVAVPTIVFHGDADPIVNPRNGRYVAARALAALPALRKVERKGRTPAGRSYVTTTHRGQNGKSFCEHWVIEDAGHAWAGGHPSGSYTDPAGPDASREMVRFFLRHRLTLRQRRAQLL